MSKPYDERVDDPRWQKAGELFSATFEPAGDLIANPHIYVNIRYSVREAALGAPDSGYADPDAVLEATVRKFIKPEARATSVLAECRRIVRSARGGGEADEQQAD